MSLKIITLNNISVVSSVGPNNEALSTQNGNLDLSTLPPQGGYPTLTVKFRSPGGEEGQVEVPIASLPVDRRRGWNELAHGVQDVLAYHVIEEQGDALVFLQRPNMEAWMEKVPDSTLLSELCVPGTHESTALHGLFISKCQTADIAEQLTDGIRFLDVRIKVNDNELQTFHGIRPEYSTLRAEIDKAEAFLRAHPSETLVMCVKEEGDGNVEFSSRVFAEFGKTDNGSMWRFGDHVPTLGEVRGKGILFTRFNKHESAPATEWADGMGLKPSGWPDDRKDGFVKEGGLGGGIDFRCHDWYGIPSVADVAEKSQRMTDFLAPTLAPSNPQPLTVVFNTASTFPLAPPQWVSRGVGVTSVGLGLEGTNSRLTAWLLRQLEQGKRPRAVIMLDYYQDNGGKSGLAPLLAAANFI